jgi:hypothetical protein
MGPSSRLLIRQWKTFEDRKMRCSLARVCVDEFVLQHAVRDPSVANQVSKLPIEIVYSH